MLRPALALFGISVAFGATGATVATASAAIPSALLTRAFPANVRALDLGRVSDAMPMHVALALTPANREQIATLIRRQNTPGDALYHRYLTPAQTRRLFSPSGAQVEAAASFLVRSGFTNVHVTPDNLIITGSGSARTARAAFATDEHVMSLGGRRFYANTAAPRLPAALASSVTSVLGLSSHPMRPMLNKKPSASSCTAVPGTSLCVLNEYNPVQFQQAYDVASAPSASATTIAIFAEGDLTQVVADLRTQEAASGLPQVPYTVVPTGAASTDTSGADEWDLDTQYSTGIAQTVSDP